MDEKKPGKELMFEQGVSKRGMQILRVRAKSNYDPLTTVRCYVDKEMRLDYDENIKDCSIVRNCGCNLFEATQITKSVVGVIKSRDFFQYFWYTITE